MGIDSSIFVKFYVNLTMRQYITPAMNFVPYHLVLFFCCSVKFPYCLCVNIIVNEHLPLVCSICLIVVCCRFNSNRISHLIVLFRRAGGGGMHRTRATSTNITIINAIIIVAHSMGIHLLITILVVVTYRYRYDVYTIQTESNGMQLNKRASSTKVCNPKCWLIGR